MNDLLQLTTALGALDRAGPGTPALTGVGWATVDTDRTLEELGGRAGLDFGAPVEEPALGATARVAWLGSVAITILEPVTEGRLAAALARRGEGIVCLYLTGEALSGGRPTSLGRPGRLLPHDRPWGPFVVLLDAPPPSVGADQGRRSP
jgi:hypothetical protein